MRVVSTAGWLGSYRLAAVTVRVWAAVTALHPRKQDGALLDCVEQCLWMRPSP